MICLCCRSPRGADGRVVLDATCDIDTTPPSTRSPPPTAGFPARLSPPSSVAKPPSMLMSLKTTDTLGTIPLVPATAKTRLARPASMIELVSPWPVIVIVFVPGKPDEFWKSSCPLVTS